MLFLIVGIGMIFVTLIFAMPESRARIFVSPEEIVLILATVQALQLHLFALFIDGLIVLTAAYFQAINQNSKAITLTLLNMLIQLPLLFLFAPWLGLIGVFLALPVSTIFLGIAALVMLKRQFARSHFRP